MSVFKPVKAQLLVGMVLAGLAGFSPVNAQGH